MFFIPVAQKSYVSFIGDFILDQQPTTYNESVIVFHNLTQQLGEAPEYNRAAKMEMVLTPLKQFCGKSQAKLVAMSEGVLNRVSEMLFELERTALKVKSSLSIFRLL